MEGHFEFNTSDKDKCNGKHEIATLQGGKKLPLIWIYVEIKFGSSSRKQEDNRGRSQNDSETVTEV